MHGTKSLLSRGVTVHHKDIVSKIGCNAGVAANLAFF
jgi:hypothetical protein